MPETGPRPRSPRVEVIAGLALVTLGIGVRLAFVTRFPTIPQSDFAGLVEMGVGLSRALVHPGPFGWDFYNPGLPVVLSFLFRIFPGAPADVARLATAIALGFVPAIPLLVLRPILSLRARVVGGLLLALWPGFVLFSGVVAQDNWVVLTTVALGSLAARTLLAKERGSPFTAAILLALAVGFRQEMLVALLPLSVAAAGDWKLPWRKLAPSLAQWAAALAVMLLLLATQRFLATDRFALTTEHSAVSVLGAYQPGAAATYWAVPGPYLAAVAPETLGDLPKARSRMSALVFDEFWKRPGFHVLRMLSGVVDSIRQVDSGTLFWSLTAPGVMPPEKAQAADELARSVSLRLDLLLRNLHLMCVLAIGIGMVRRSRAILVLALAVLLKLAIHAALVTQPRYFVPAIALEMLIIALAVDELPALGWRRFGVAVVVSGFLAWATMASASAARGYVLRHDFDGQPSFSFGGPAGSRLLCKVESGQLLVWSDETAAFGILEEADRIGRLSCRAAGTRGALAIELKSTCDAPCPQQFVTLRANVDGQEVLSADASALLEPRRIPLGGAPVELFVERSAAQPPDHWRVRSRMVLRVVEAVGSSSP